MTRSTLISAIHFNPGNGQPRTDIPDQAAYHLMLAGWKPPVTRVVTYIDEELHEREATVQGWGEPEISAEKVGWALAVQQHKRRRKLTGAQVDTIRTVAREQTITSAAIEDVHPKDTP